MTTYHTHSPQETEELAAALAQRLNAGDVIAYRGTLGAGKTCFTRGLAAGLGISTGVSSPTFALVHEYRGERLTLYHFDMYRIEGEDDLYSTGFYDYLDDPCALLAIEWSENIDFALDFPHITVEIAPGAKEDERVITIKGDGRF